METANNKWKEIKTEMPKSHKVVEFLRENGPKAPIEIFKKLNINETTGYATISRLTSWGLIKHLSDSNKYVHKDFVDEEAKIYEMVNRILEFIENQVFKGKSHPFLTKSIFIFTATRLKMSYDSEDFQKAMFLAGKRFNIPWKPGHMPVIDKNK